MKTHKRVKQKIEKEKNEDRGIGGLHILGKKETTKRVNKWIV